VDAETRQMVENMAKFVAEGGPEVEAIAIERNRDNPAFRSFTISMTVFCNPETLFHLDLT